MYAMTAAHPTLPIPSYVRVTRVATGRSVVVRVNDRGPFLNNRVIDLSWTAAAKLGYVTAGSTEVEIEALTPDSPVEMPTAVASATSGGPAAGSSASAPGGGPAGGSSAAAAATAGAVASAGTAAGAQSGSGLGGGAPAASSGAVPPLVPPAAPDTVATIPVESRLIVETIALSADKNPGTAAAPPGAAAGTIYLQLGAFGSRDNAEAARGRMDRQFDWLSGRTDVRAEGSRFLVRAGPYATRELARTDAERIAQATGVRPFAITR
jgi:rare lipoprotein A